MPRRAVAEPYNTDDVINEYGEVQAKKDTDGTLFWVLPGRGITYCKDEAIRIANRLNQMVKANLKRYDRKLV